jgi:hypothetical protein
MTHTHHPGLVTTFNLRINRQHYVEVFIWQDKDSMYAADDFNKEHTKQNNAWSNREGRNFAGQATQLLQAVPNGVGKIRIPRKFGEIFIVKDCYGSKVVSHEIAHIVNYWGGTHGWIRDGKDDEKSARLTGNLNGQFWQEYYKRFS